MGVLNKFVAATALFAMAILLFVVVCPATPTPTAIAVHSRTSAPQITVATPFVAVLLAATLFTLMLLRAERASDAETVPQPLPVLDRTCVCLC